MEKLPKRPPREHAEELLDAALADTFPASDPVSSLVPDAPSRRPRADQVRKPESDE